MPFRFSGFSFDVTSTLVFFIVAIVSLIESTGVYHALSEITGKKLERKDFRKGYTAEGLAIVLGSIYSIHFRTAYSQNVGLVSLSVLTMLYTAWSCYYLYVVVYLSLAH